ncbi:glycosyltransferase family 4 protein [Bizionia sp.]|uniref:glycosyltransferase family 4 protein n=1 Tax=Bizionia sp. TaxID=1954480 RepID=UPI003A9326D1
MSNLHSEGQFSVTNKPKIAFVITSLTSGGAERVLSTLANSFVADYQVTIITLYNVMPFYELDSRIKHISCKESYNKNMRFIDSLTNNVYMIGSLYRILKKEQISVAIGFMTTTNIYTIIASKFARIPCLISERTHPDYDPLSNFWIKIRKKTYPYCTKLIVQTAGIKSYFSKFLNPEKLAIIKNPLADSLIAFRDESKQKENIILSVGRLDPVKNQRLLIEAFSEMEIDNWKIQIVGEGELRSELQALINDLNLENSVELVGSVDNVHDYYNKARIFAFTSNFEGFPNALIEAMAFGLPCISTNCPSGPNEVIDDGENGFLIPVGDKNMLKRKLEILITQPELGERFGASAKASTTKFETKHISEQWKHLITEALQG